MKKNICLALLLAVIPFQQSYGFATQSITIPKNEQLTSININPTFQNAYSELMVPSSVISKIQRELSTSPVQVTVEITKSKKNYKVIFTAKTTAGKTVASKKFTSIIDKNRKKIPTTTPYLHTNFNYRLSINPKDSAFKLINDNPFIIEFRS